MQWLGRRLLNLVVGVFALLGFCLVPLGDHTALGHMVALGRTDAARHLAQGLATGIRAVAAELKTAGQGSTRAPRGAAGPNPGAPSLPPPRNAKVLDIADAGADVSEPWPDG